MWNHIKAFFSDSETIFWARLNLLIGVAAVALTYVEPQMLKPVMPADWFPWLFVANGIATEYLRRRRESDM